MLASIAKREMFRSALRCKNTHFFPNKLQSYGKSVRGKCHDEGEQHHGCPPNNTILVVYECHTRGIVGVRKSAYLCTVEKTY